MKNSFRNSLYGAVSALIIMVVLFSATTNAQSIGKTRAAKKAAITNLKSALESDNKGVRRSAISFAGKYKVTEVAENLVERFKNETDNNLKILIGLSLYQMGSEEGLQKVMDLTQNADDSQVKTTISQMYEQIKQAQPMTTAFMGN